jgi:hypothetical protein
MGEQFITFINNPENRLKEVTVDPKVSQTKWSMLINFLMTPQSKVQYDKDKVTKIIMDIKKLCPENLIHLYGTRLTEHHAILMFEGLLKWRIVFKKDRTLTAKEEDYVLFESLWEYIIKSWKGNQVNLLTKFENIVLDMVPETGIHRTTLVRRAEKIFNANDDNDKFVTKIIKDLRNYGLIENGKKDELDRQTIYKVKEKELTINELPGLEDSNQLKLDF